MVASVWFSSRTITPPWPRWPGAGPRSSAALHDAAGELVDDLDLAVHHHVLLVAVEHVLGLERLLEVVDELAGNVGVDVVDARARSTFFRPSLRGGNGALGLVHLEVDPRGTDRAGTGAKSL